MVLYADMGNLLFNICLFFACLVLFHVMMFAIGKRPRFWTAVEYIWLSSAALGLIGFTEKARQVELHNEIRDTERRLDREIEVAQSSAERYLRYAQRLHQRNHPQWDTEVVAGFELIVEKLDEPVSKRPWEEIFKRYPSYGDKNDTRSLGGKLVYINKTYDELERLRDVMRPSEAERKFAEMYPLLFSIALSLRITKVTAGWLKYA